MYGGERCWGLTFAPRFSILSIVSTPCLIMRISDQLKIDRSVIEVQTLHDLDDREDVAYWRTRPLIERMRGLEALRQAMYDYDPDTARLPRVFEVLVRTPR